VEDLASSVSPVDDVVTNPAGRGSWNAWHGGDVTATLYPRQRK
jgi:hypothetical protein